jgi:hypothetical protein
MLSILAEFSHLTNIQSLIYHLNCTLKFPPKPKHQLLRYDFPIKIFNFFLGKALCKLLLMFRDNFVLFHRIKLNLNYANLFLSKYNEIPFLQIFLYSIKPKIFYQIKHYELLLNQLLS